MQLVQSMSDMTKLLASGNVVETSNSSRRSSTSRKKQSILFSAERVMQTIRKSQREEAASEMTENVKDRIRKSLY